MSFASPPNSGSGDYGWRPPTTFIDVLFLVLAFFVTVVAFVFYWPIWVGKPMSPDEIQARHFWEAY